MGVCNKVINDQLEELRTEKFSRKRIFDNLQHMMGRMAYVAAPDIIPPGVEEVGFAGDRYKVLHLKHRVCSSGAMTHYPDWYGLKPGRYLESKGLIIIDYTGPAVTQRMAAAPVARILKAHAGSRGETAPIIEFTFIKQASKFVWNEGLKAIEFVDDKPDILYYDEDGTPRRQYPWMAEDEDTDEEQYAKAVSHAESVALYVADFESRMEQMGYTKNLPALREILIDVLSRQG